MSQPIVARRYAKALYEQAEVLGVTELVDADVTLIRDTLKASRDLVFLFDSPIVSRDRKRAAVRSLLADRVQEVTMKFVDLLVEWKTFVHPPAAQLATLVQVTLIGHELHADAL